jgi:hypothetical protein
MGAGPGAGAEAVTDELTELTDEEIREIARDLGMSEAGARALIGAVMAEENPPPGKIVTV